MTKCIFRALLHGSWGIPLLLHIIATRGLKIRGWVRCAEPKRMSGMLNKDVREGKGL